MTYVKAFIGVLSAGIAFLSLLQPTETAFTVDYDNDTFLMDGAPFRYVSGSVHYFRVPREYWRDRLRKLRAAGLNAVSTYVEWSQHEPAPGQYDFSGDRNLTEFLRIAQEEGLYVLLRPGPYICAERDMGGFPYWLLINQPDVYLRSNDDRYTTPVKNWIDVLMPIVQPYLHGNGGPVILVQVENEYGFYPACDGPYKSWLRDLFVSYVEDKAILYTTDGAGALGCGSIEGVFPTIDFGPGTNVTDVFGQLRKYLPKGPLVNSEFYPGWLTHWGEDMAHRDTNDVIKTLREILEAGANVNFYMFYGGTNFGFTAGANGDDNSYQSDITSYDYEAPISEAGDLTEKYYAIRDVVGEYLPLPGISVKTSDKGDYGELTLKGAATLFSPRLRTALGVLNQEKYPKTFESVGQNYGYLLYETTIPVTTTTKTELTVPSFHDLAKINLNGKFVGSLSRESREYKLDLPVTNTGDKLAITVENLGRVNFGDRNNDSKGLLENVTFNGNLLESWDMTSFELKDLTSVEDCNKNENQNECYGDGFVFYVTNFVLNSEVLEDNHPLDSYLDVSNLQKGLVFVNNINLGRYWSTRKPQKTLYVPGVYLKPPPAENTIIIMDEELREDNLKITFTTQPNFSSL